MKEWPDIEQGTEEWFQLRGNYFTASEVGPFILATGKVAENARLNLICDKLGAPAGVIEPQRGSFATDRGNELEPLARAFFEVETGLEVRQTGFCSHDSLMIGCSPDGLVGDDAGLEIKCKMPKAHVRMLLDGIVPEEHLFQIHHSMIVTGRRKWHFIGFCPAMPQLIRVVQWNDFTDKLETGLRSLCEDFKIQKARMKQIWDEQSKK